MTVVQQPVADAGPRSTRLPLVRWRPVPAAIAVAGALHLLWWMLRDTAGGDLAAQVAWTEFARTHPGSAYDLAWYGGMHPVSYSVLSPYLMAVLGVRPTLVVAGTLSAGLLAWLVDRGGAVRHPVWPAMYGALALVGNAVSGRATFALGTMFALAVLCVLFTWPDRWRKDGRDRWLRGTLAALLATVATAASPVAGLFLGLVAVALWLDHRRAAAYAVGVPPAAVVALSAWLFPFSGEQPMSWSDAILPVVLGLLVVVLAPRSWRTVRLGGVVYVVAVVLAWLVPSPVGSNISRLGLLFGGVVLVAVAADARVRASLVARRAGSTCATVLLTLAILTSTVWQVALAAQDAVRGSPPPSLHASADSLVAALERRDAGLGRVEFVPTRSHWEAAALAPHLNLARGWNRQADAARNPLFYRSRPPTALEYRNWLHRWAVRYVVLSTAEPDPAAVAEAKIVASDPPYLRPVWGNADWTVFAVRNPTPLVARPGRVLDFDAAGITLHTPVAGSLVIRVPDSPWLSLVDQDGHPLTAPDDASDTPALPCLSSLDADESDDAQTHRRDDWLVLHAPHAGTYRIAAPYKLPRGTSCR